MPPTCRGWAWALLLMAAFAGCESGGSAIGSDNGLTPDFGYLDSGRAADVIEAGTVPEVARAADTELDFYLGETEVTKDLDAPEPGMAGYPCTTGADCNQGYCIQTPDGPACTVTCEDECPFDWQCLLYTPSHPDVFYLCISPFVELCKPCSANTDCWSNGVDAGEACVSYGEAGFFCGGACDAMECPAGYLCEERVDVAGASTAQCVLPDGECTCSQWFVDQGAETVCHKLNDWGLCSGERTCLAGGLTVCSAAVPGAEKCNGADDDCNGDADDGLSGAECLVTNQYGACPGTLYCIDGVENCEGAAPLAEQCDGQDNNCDGQVDESFPDTDEDGVADCLETDKDSDGIPDGLDNCPGKFNPGQTDTDFDTIGDVCDPDDDNDMVPDDQDCSSLDGGVYPGAEEICDGKDNDCNYIVDEGFLDADNDGWKDCVDADDDNDGIEDGADCGPHEASVYPGAPELCDGLDNDCDFDVDEGYPDGDGDGLADCADQDQDNDGVANAADNCPAVANEDQEDQDEDGLGDGCDADLDGDAVANVVDNCPSLANTPQADADGDGLGNACDEDMDGDTVANGNDNCPQIANLAQEDADEDGTGDACEDDKDGDGSPDGLDCAPLDAAAFPGADEVCDGVDNNCNLAVDEGFPDTDQDLLKDCVDGDDDNDMAPDEADCAPQNGAIHPGAEELCDSDDNDCDGKIDEGLALLACGKGECFHTQPSCIDGEVYICDPLDGIAFEICDGLDNDCDGLVDEDQGTTTCGFGGCQHTVANCQGGEVVACDPLEGEGPEVCDGQDNDCDGQVDEALGNASCGKGQCYHTVVVCQGGVVTQCDPFAGALPETCDGSDNDCDGDEDEELGETTCGLGVCEHTAANCLDGVPQACNPLAGALPEACDNLDNNCDGFVDNGLGTITCGLGECQHTLPYCDDGEIPECLPKDGASLEVCDGLDNDCDGLVDEELGNTICGLGNCLHSAVNCVAGEPNECDPLLGAADEVCNGLDENCDGTADDGFDDTDSDGDADCVDDDDDDDGDPDVSDCAPLDATVGHTLTEVCFNGIDEDCDGVADPDDDCVFVSCQALHIAHPAVPTGTYKIDPDGEGLGEALEVLCDMDVDGGGWTVIDGKVPYDTGAECNLSEITEQGVIRLKPQNCCVTSLSHGGCGFWTTTKIPYQKIRVSDFSGTLNSCGNVLFNNPKVNAFKGDAVQPVDGAYPGWNPECKNGACASVWKREYNGGLGNGIYDTADTEPKYIHFGVGGFSTCNYVGTAKLMVR